MADITITIANEVSAGGLVTGLVRLPLVGRTGGGSTKLDGLNPALYAAGAYVEFDDATLGVIRYVKDTGVGVEADPEVIVPDSGSGHWRKRL